ncbi:BigA/YdbA N-terminal beta-barrel domain-containing protein [Yokenella regensburgei]|uniref:BigA/YdbA N-terminal beta-barrel domain-containing protein n=1 Tax=Yokenella regensburgei TaxID=158877 RepID=UPI0002FEB6DB
MALSSNAWATDTDDVNDSKVKCPTQVSQLTEAEKAALPAECKTDDDSLTGWVLGGAAAVAAAIGVTMYNDNSGGYAHHDNHSPAPPDDGGDSGTLPDDGGDSGTLPDDGGDSGTNPDDGGDSGTDPDDGGDSGTDPVATTYYYDNGVTLDTEANTLTFDTVSVNGESWDNVIFNYVEEGDNYVLTAPDGRTLVIDKKYVTDENNAVIDGTYGSDDLTWKYDSTGTFWFADADTNIIAGDGESTTLGDTTTDGENQIGTLIIGDNTETTWKVTPPPAMAPSAWWSPATTPKPAISAIFMPPAAPPGCIFPATTTSLPTSAALPPSITVPPGLSSTGISLSSVTPAPLTAA